MTVKVDLDTHHVLLKFDLDGLSFYKVYKVILHFLLSTCALHTGICYTNIFSQIGNISMEISIGLKILWMDEALTGGAEATHSNNCLHKSKDNRVNTYRHVETVNHV